CYVPRLYPPSSPTRRSSDLAELAVEVLRPLGLLRVERPAHLRVQVESGHEPVGRPAHGLEAELDVRRRPIVVDPALDLAPLLGRSEEHTSELQSRENLVCRL